MSMNALTKPKISSKSPKIIEGYPGTKYSKFDFEKVVEMNFVKNCPNPEIHGKGQKPGNQK